ncbi:hypothetical protein LDENG_00211520 [Lucifuga dentata]|nr:hypothetical protein LDENG_00211520 [Lucifuga dentata]
MRTLTGFTRTLTWIHTDVNMPHRLELSDHVENIDTRLENLHNILNSQTFTIDTSPIMEFISSYPSGEFDLDSLDTLLSAEMPKTAGDNDDANTGKQLVQYSATPILMTEPNTLGEGGANLPSLLELEAGPYFSTDSPTEEPTVSFLLSPDLTTQTDLENDL